MNAFVFVRLQVVGETGLVDHVHLDRMAAHFALDADEHAVHLIQLLANLRAASCIDELVRRGIDRTRLVATNRPQTGNLSTEFSPQPMEVIAEQRRLERLRLDTEAGRALQHVMQFMEDHDVVFNGARKKIHTYKLGAAQVTEHPSHRFSPALSLKTCRPFVAT